MSNFFVCNARFSARSISWCRNLIRSRVELSIIQQSHACLHTLLLACTRDYLRVKRVAKIFLENSSMAILRVLMRLGGPDPLASHNQSRSNAIGHGHLGMTDASNPWLNRSPTHHVTKVESGQKAIRAAEMRRFWSL